MKQLQRTLMLFFISFFPSIAIAQLPSQDEVIALVIAQKKASDSKDALPFIPAPGSKPKLFPGHYTSYYNDECIVLCSILQGRDIIQVVLLLYKTKEGYWINGCWYYDNIYRIKIKDFNKDDVQELILETKINAGNRSYAGYKVISLLNENTTIWYENNTVLGHDLESLKQAQKGKEITKNVKVTLLDTSKVLPCIINERTTIGWFNNYTDSAGAKLDYETMHKEYKFVENKYVPKLN